jgi:hypothetical protein
MREKKCLNQNFFSSWNPAMAYVLGFFVADGTMTLTKRGGKYIAFHITDKELLESIRSLMGSNHAIAVRVRDVRWKLGYRLQIGSKQLFDDLTQLGFAPNKSNNLAFPDVPKKYFGEYARGYFDGDGCVYHNFLAVKGRKNKKHILQTRFTSGDKQYLQDFLRALQEKGGIGGGYIVTKQNKRGFELSLSHRDSLAIYRIMYNNTPTCGVRLERKFEKFTRAIQAMYPDAVVA